MEEDFEFEFKDDDFNLNVNDGGFDDAFSQLLNEAATVTVNSSSHEPPKKKRAPNRKKPSTQPATLADFEEAFTCLKSIQAAHEPISTTAINAFLFYRRGVDTTKRTVSALAWPEHPQTFTQNRLIASSQGNYTDLQNDDRPAPPIPLFYTCESGSDSEGDLVAENANVPLCEMDHNPNLYAALLRTCQSIYRQKLTNPNAEIDPHLSHVISRRCSLLLQQLFIRALLTRRSAINALQHNGQTRYTDVDNVPVNWEDTREAARQLVGLASIDFELFSKFSARLNRTFSRK